MRQLCRAGYLACALFIAPPATADRGEAGLAADGILTIKMAPAAIHFESSPEHRGTSWLLGLEWQQPSRWLGGYAYFNNSFDQKCHYLYVGRTWTISERNPAWYIKVSGGALLGYKEPYDNKIPINSNGIGLAVVPGIGYKTDRYSVQLNLLGNAGLMMTFGFDIVR